MSARAFKIDTHVWVAQQILNELDTYGHLRIAGESYYLRPEVKEALLNHRDAYRLGSIGPDGFPDMVGPQVTTHPGLPDVEGGWVTDDWLRWVMGRANRPEERAFAFGYLTHAAGDVFSHTYVNTYAGDAFDFMDEVEVELRHMVLENYILEHQPPLTDFTLTEIYDAHKINLSDSLAEWLAETLILNEQVAGQYALVPSGVTSYLVQMFEAYQFMDQLVKDAREAESGLLSGLSSLKSRVTSLKKKKVKVKLGWFGSFSVKLWPWYCFVDPGGCILIESTAVSLELTKQFLDLSTNLGLKPLIDWRNQIRAAVIAYIRASREVASEMMREEYDYQRPPYPPERDPTKPLKDWILCFGPAFAGVPPEVTAPGCTAIQGLQSLLSLKDRYRSWEQDLTDELGRFEWVLAPHNAMSRVRFNITEYLKAGFGEIGQDVAGEDSPLFDIIELRREKDLAQVFLADSSDKKLPVLTDIKERIMADMGITSDDENWSPHDFAVIAHSLTLSKLLLLDAAELNRMAMNAGVHCSLYGDTPFVASPDFNLMFGWIRSIDGNHQWQPYAPPYPRRITTGDDKGYAESDPQERHYGYYHNEESQSALTGYSRQTGFPLWQDEGLQKQLFRKLFAKPLLEKDLLPQDHPSHADENNPFPKSVDDVYGNRIAHKADCLNTYVLISESPADLIFRFPEPPGCLPEGSNPQNLRYLWSFIQEVVEKRHSPIRADEGRSLDPDLVRTWSYKHWLTGAVLTFEGSLNELVLKQEINSIKLLSESITRDEESGQWIVSFRMQKVIDSLGISTSHGPEYPSSSRVDRKGNLMCGGGPNPTFIKGPKSDLLLQVKVLWDDPVKGRMECYEHFRVMEFRNPDLNHIDSFSDLRNWTRPCEVPTNIVEPASRLQLAMLRPHRDFGGPSLANLHDREFDFSTEPLTREGLEVPNVMDTWFRHEDITLQNDAPDVLPLGTTTVHWSATDLNGNFTTVSQKITVTDREPPRFVNTSGSGGRPGAGGSGPGGSGGGTRDSYADLEDLELLQSGAGQISAANLVTPEAVDNYPGEVTVTLEAPEETYLLGESIVTWVARDISGNETRANQVIRVTSLLGDIDLDGDVDDDDLAILEQGLGEPAVGLGTIVLGDFNEDGRVDFEDEILRDEMQAYIEGISVDLRDLDGDGWITEMDRSLLHQSLTPEAGFSVVSEFASLPPYVTLVGDAAVDEEQLLLSESGSGTVFITPPSQSRQITALSLSFNLAYEWRSQPTAGEGVSVCFGPDLPQSGFDETGGGSGLRILLRLATSRVGPPRSVQVWFEDRLLGSSEDLGFVSGSTQPLQFKLQIHADQTLSIWLNNESEHLLLDRIPGYEPRSGSFGIGARTSLNALGHQWIDDLHLDAMYDAPHLPPHLTLQTTANQRQLQLILKGTPGQDYQIETSTNLKLWIPWRQVTIPEGTSTTDAEPVTGEDEARFFRARIP